MLETVQSLSVDRIELKPEKNSTVWDTSNELPLQWLEEVDANGYYSPTFDGHSPHFGVGVYKDGSVSVGFQIESTDPQFLSDAVSDLIHTNLEAAISSIDYNTHLQFLPCALDEDQVTLSIYEKDRDGLPPHPIQAFTRKGYIERDKARLERGELKSYTCPIFVNIPYEERNEAAPAKTTTKTLFGGIVEGFGSFINQIISFGSLIEVESVETENAHLHKRITSCLERAQGFMNALAACPGLTVSPINANEYCRLLYRIWSPDHWQIDRLQHGKTLEALFSQLKYRLATHVMFDKIDDGHWQYKTGRHYHRILSLRVPPEESDIGLMYGVMLGGTNTDIYNSQYSLTVRPVNASEEVERLKYNLKVFSKMRDANPNEHLDLVPRIQHIQNQILKLSSSEGTHLFQTVLMVHIWHEDPKILDRWEQSLIRGFSLHPLKARLSLESPNALPYALGYFTPGFTRYKDTFRSFNYTALEVATHVPLIPTTTAFIQTRGKSRRAPRLYETHRGTLLLQDDFARGKVHAWNGIGIGTTGSGKSMFYNLKIASILSRQDKVIILDNSKNDGSYRPISQLFDGNYIDYNLRHPDRIIGINPLQTEILPNGHFRDPTMDELNRMVNLIEPMVRKHQNIILNEQERACIYAALRQTFESFKDNNGRVRLPMLALALKSRANLDKSSINLRAADMGQQLEDLWCGPKGLYAAFVDCETTVLKASNLNVYDLKGLKENPALKGVVTANLINYLYSVTNENLRKREEDQVRTTFIGDEIHAALTDPILASSLINLPRESRGLNVSVHFLSQLMEDMKKIMLTADSSTGSTAVDPKNNSIVSNTSWFNLFLHQSEEDIRMTQEVLGLPDIQAQEIKNLQAVPGQYREMIQYVRGQNGTSFNKLRIRPLPFELNAYTSDLQEIGRKNSLRDKIQKEWLPAGTRKKVRQAAISRLENMGFLEADTLHDAQIIEILTAIDLK